MVTEIELGLHRNDGALLVMPMCHANSLNFFGAFGYCGGVNVDLFAQEFRSRALRPTLAEGGSTFTSLVPTHYIMMLGLPAAVRGKYDFDAVTKLMISSAPARHDTKRDVMAMFPQLRPLRALRRHRSRMGHDAPSARAIHEARFGRPRMRGVGADQDCSTNPATRCQTANPANSSPATPTRSTDIGACRTRPSRRSAATLHGRRHGAPRPGGLHPSRRSQEQHDHLRRRKHLSVRGRSADRRAPTWSRTSP